MNDNNLNVPVSEILEIFYRGVLQRMPSEQEINVHISSCNNIDNDKLVKILRSFLVSSEFKNQLPQLYPLLLPNDTTDLINACESYALFPVFNEVWLPFALSCCEYIWKEYCVKSLLVTDGQINAVKHALNEFDFLIGSHEKESVNTIIELKEPALFFAHSHVWPDLTSTIIDKCPASVMFLIGDGFRNQPYPTWEHKRNVYCAISWGFDDGVCGHYLKKIIEYSSIEFYRDFIADKLLSQSMAANDIDNYDAFYVRYWGEGGAYQGISLQDVVTSWVDTVSMYTMPGTTLVIKGVPRVSSSLMNVFRTQLAIKNVKYIDFDEYAKKVRFECEYIDALPVEYSYRKGLLCNAGRHYVLDSSLAFVIAHSAHIRKPCSIVLGVQSDVVNGFPEEAVEQIKNFIEHSRKAIIDSIDFFGAEIASDDVFVILNLL